MSVTDLFGFVLLEGDQQTDENAKRLYASICEDDGRDDLPPVGHDEILYAYHFGDVLSGRWGWLVVNKEGPTRVLRYKSTRIS